MSRNGYSTGAFSRNVDDILRTAESTLGRRHTDPHTSIARRESEYAAKEGMHLVAATPYEDEPTMMNAVEMSRQLRVCMREIRDLRTELQAERENRNGISMLQIKRMREELRVEQKQSEHTLLQTVRELEGVVTQKLHSIDGLYSLERKRIEDVLRMAKVADRSHFDTAEQLRDAIEETKLTSTRAVSAADAIRSEVVRLVERENSRLSSRMDEQMTRILELHRQQQAALSDTKNAVAVEVATAAKQIDILVEKAWTAQSAAANRKVDDRLSTFETFLKRSDAQALELSAQMQKHVRDSKLESSHTTSDLQNRIMSLESSLPLLVGRIDRTERKGDGVVESANKLAAHVEVLKDSSDRAQVQGQRAVDKTQKLEDSMADRDQRITVLESQLSAVAGVERWRQDLELIRRAIQRVETQVDAVKGITDKDEKAVSSMQAQVEEAAEKVYRQEKLSQKTATKLEAAEAKVNGFLDRLGQLENEATAQSSRVGASTEVAEGAAQRVAMLENKFKSVADRTEVVHREATAKTISIEGRLEAFADALSQASVLTATIRKDVERVEKKTAKAEGAALNASDNSKEVHDQLESTNNEIAAIKRRIDALSKGAGSSSAAHLKDETNAETIASIEGKISALRSSVEASSGRAAQAEERLKTSLSNLKLTVESDMSRLKEDVREATRRAEAANIVAQSAVESCDACQRHQTKLSVDIQQVARRVVEVPTVATPFDGATYATKTELAATAAQLRVEIGAAVSSIRSDPSRTSATALPTLSQHALSAATVNISNDSPSPVTVAEPSSQQLSKQPSIVTSPAAVGKPPIIPPQFGTPSTSRIYSTPQGHHMPTTWSEVKKTPYSESEGEFDTPDVGHRRSEPLTVKLALEKSDSASELTKSGSFHLAGSPRELQRVPVPVAAIIPASSVSKPAAFSHFDATTEDEYVGPELPTEATMVSSAPEASKVSSAPEATKVGSAPEVGSSPTATPPQQSHLVAMDEEEGTYSEDDLVQLPDGAPREIATNNFDESASVVEEVEEVEELEPPKLPTMGIASSSVATPMISTQAVVAPVKANPFANATLDDFDDGSEEEVGAEEPVGARDGNMFDDSQSDGGAAQETVLAQPLSTAKPPLGNSAAAKKAIAATASSSDDESDGGLALPDNIGASKAKHYVSESSGPEESPTYYRRGGSSAAMHQPAPAAVARKVATSNFDDDSSEDEKLITPIITTSASQARLGGGASATTKNGPIAGRRMSPTSGRSRRTTDVSLSLTSTSSPQSKRKEEHSDSSDEGADDDTLARMLGTMK